MFNPLITDASKKFGNNRWLVFSNKLNRTVYLFSDLEYEHCLNVEFDYNIISYCEQPLKVSSIIDDKEVFSIFDMWIQYKDGYEEFIEVKYTSDLSKETVIRQINVQKKWCEENSLNYRVVTEKDIKIAPVKLSNMKLIIKLNTNHQEDSLKAKDIKKALKESTNKLSIEELAVQSELDYDQTIKIVAYLIYTNEIKADINIKPFGKKTEVWI